MASCTNDVLAYPCSYITPEHGQVVLKKINEESVGTIIQGYFLPTLKKNAITYANNCHRSQIFAPEELTSILYPWPLDKRGNDIIGPLPRATRKVKFALVTVDYFTK